MPDPRPIGLLDSGVGGLSVLRDVRRLLPAEHLVYVGDQAHLPYGTRTRDELRGFVVEITRFLLRQGIKMLVIPCNSANAAALHHLRATFPDLPIVGMEPAIKPAAENTKTGVIGVITTQATFQGELFASVLDRFAQGVRVETQVCPDLVLLAEAGAPHTPEAHQTVADYVAPLQAAGIDQLVLGCTHFPFLENHLRVALGPGVQIVDPGPAVARQTRRVLSERGLETPRQEAGHITYFTSGNPDQFRAALRALLFEDGDVRPAVWENSTLRAG